MWIWVIPWKWSFGKRPGRRFGNTSKDTIIAGVCIPPELDESHVIRVETVGRRNAENWLTLTIYYVMFDVRNWAS